MELLDKFRAVQERARRQTMQQYSNKPSGPGNNGNGVGTMSATFTPPRVPTPSGGTGGNAPGAPGGNSKPRSGLTGIGRLAGGRKAAPRGK